MLFLLNFNLASGMAAGKGGEFVFTVGKAFLKPGLKLSEEGKLYSTIIPIPPVNLTANINEAYTAAKQILTNNSKEFESKVRLLKDDAGNIIKDADGNVHGEIEVTLNNGNKEKVEVLLNEDEAKLKQAAGEIDESGNINNAGKAGIYTTTIKWRNLTIEARPFGKGFMGKRIIQSDPRVNAYELKINPNDESFYLWNTNQDRYVQFENISENMLQDGKCVLNPENSIYRVYDKPEFLRKNILEEATTQVETANLNGLQVEWLVSDKVAVEQLQKFFKENNLNITVKYLAE